MAGPSCFFSPEVAATAACQCVFGWASSLSAITMYFWALLATVCSISTIDSMKCGRRRVSPLTWRKASPRVSLYLRVQADISLHEVVRVMFHHSIEWS